MPEPAPFACRVCGDPAPIPVLSLGELPLANGLLSGEELDRPAPRWPLDLVICPGCALVQITATVPPEALFRHYLYFSSFSDTALRHAAALATRMVCSQSLGPHSLVLEVASNDGYLLRHYLKHGVPVLGIEPARNVARVAREEHGVETIEEFFGPELAERLAAQGRRADVLHAHNVLAHVADPVGFVRGAARVLAPNGLLVIEVPYLEDLVARGEFDTIYHEHLSYFSLSSLRALLLRGGLGLVDVERLPVHGGSLRVLARAGAWEATPAVEELLRQERAWGLLGPERLRQLARRVDRLRQELVGLLRRLRADGLRIAAYGAAAKGCTLLNALGIGGELLEFVVDRSPHKQGRWLPGVQLPIHPPARLLECMPDRVLLLAWNLADEVLSQQAEYVRRGGRFIVPLPELRVVP